MLAVAGWICQMDAGIGRRAARHHSGLLTCIANFRWISDEISAHKNTSLLGHNDVEIKTERQRLTTQ